jgi:hypothetical protein
MVCKWIFANFAKKISAVEKSAFQRHDKSMRGAVKALDVALDRPTYDRGWMPGTYLVSGVFPIKLPDPGSEGAPPEMTYEQITRRAEPLLAEVAKNKQTLWPRGIAGYYAVPIFYQHGEFSEELYVRIYQHNQYYKWGMWFDPVLLDLENRKVWMRQGFENRRFVFWRKLLSLAFSGLTAITLAEIGETTLDVNAGELNLPIKERKKPSAPPGPHPGGAK